MKPVPQISDIQSPLAFMPEPHPDMFPLTQENEARKRKEFIEVLLSWSGTPYRSCGASKGVGVDCAMLLLQSAIEAKVYMPFDPRPYPSEWHLHQTEERYINWVKLMADEISPEEAKPGDVILYKFGLCYSHAAVLVSPDEVVHAFIKDEICCTAATFTSELVYDMEETNRVRGLTPTERRLIKRDKKFFDVWACMRRRYASASADAEAEDKL